MRKNNKTSMSFPERLFAAITFTAFLVVYQQIWQGNPSSFSQTIINVLPSISSSKIFPQ